MALSGDELELNSIEYRMKWNKKDIFLGKLLQRKYSGDGIAGNIFIFEHMPLTQLNNYLRKSKIFYEADITCCCFPFVNYIVTNHPPLYMIFTPQ